MNNKVWIVEQGCYSDYSVVGIFSSEENAKAICEKINEGDDWDEATVAERTLDPWVDALNEGLNQYIVNMDMDGTTTRIELVEGLVTYSDELSVHKRTEAPHWKGKPIQDQVNGHVFAKDQTHAIKITNEFRAMKIALGEMSRRD